ncbi:Ttll4 [Symbiodinium natans]|uniref:Ttll4 protein n=1 Tax=Symbiodinium natans TaxID=878477 RepID=A0A812MUL2_9DINO|nr:Ttll4 [Symbiodinium natans]
MRPRVPWICILTCLQAREPQDALCRADGTGGCAQHAGSKLSWRARPYGTKGEGQWQIYGGSYIRLIFDQVDFEGPVEDDEWHLLWTHFPMDNYLRNLSGGPRLVHGCQYFTAAGQKCTLANHLLRVQAALKQDAGEDHDHLQTYILRNQTQVTEFRRRLSQEPDKLWLIKSCSAGRSNGIVLLNGRPEHSDTLHKVMFTWAVAQKYMENPYLGFGGSKFHMRLYVLVTTWHSPAIFLFDEGFIFRSRHKYDPSSPSVERDVFSAVSDEVENLALSSLWSHLGEQASEVRLRLRRVLAETLGVSLKESFGPAERLDERPYACFDIFGVDVMLDEHLQPFVLEVNTGPNLWLDEQTAAKQAVIKGAFVHQVLLWAHEWLQRRRSDQPTDQAHKMLLNFTKLL